MKSPWTALCAAGLAAGLFLAPPAAGSQAVQGADKWTWTAEELEAVKKLEKTVTAKNSRFLLERERWKVETFISPRFTAEVAQFMEMAERSFAQIIEGKSAVPLKPTVLVYASQQDYEKRFKDGTRGQFKYRWNELGEWEENHLYTYLRLPVERDFSSFHWKTLQHEGAHAFLRNLVGKSEVPPWFDEGIATYFESWDLRTDAAANQKDRYSRSRYRRHLKDHCLTNPGRFLNLPELMKIRAPAWNSDKMGPEATHNYARAESVIDYFLASDETKGIFKRLVESAMAGKGVLVSDDELRTLEVGWRKHVENAVK